MIINYCSAVSTSTISPEYGYELLREYTFTLRDVVFDTYSCLILYYEKLLVGAVMPKNAELQRKAGLLRTAELVSRYAGSFILGVAVLLDFSTGGDIAHNTVYDIHGGLILADVFGTAGGVGILSYSSSLGRRADVIDAELLRRESGAESLPPIPQSAQH